MQNDTKKISLKKYLQNICGISLLLICCITLQTKADDSDISDLNIKNKEDVFGGILTTSVKSNSSSTLAEQIRKQREAIEARENSELFTSNLQNSLNSGKNECDTGLRKCMLDTCGKNFSKCAIDSDTLFGDKLNKCRRNLNCSGEEFKLFTNEIKADRDLNAQLSSFESVVECGNEYNGCLVKECGATFNKCLSKTKEDAAKSKCAEIAKKCTEQDSGLSSRFSTVIGKLRENAETEIKQDEEKMYSLRDSMRSRCQKLGAMFDERSFDCVFTVNFFAGTDITTTPKASRKAYAGDSFVCMQEWFGINVTTFKENAYRETRAQTAASSAMLGSGVGTAVGLVTSGAMGRALDTQKAKKDLKSACEASGGKFEKGECIGGNPDMNSDSDSNSETDEEAEDQKVTKEDECTTKKGTYKNGSCWCGAEMLYKKYNSCDEQTSAKEDRKKKMKDNNQKIKEKMKATNDKVKANVKATNEKIKVSMQKKSK